MGVFRRERAATLCGRGHGHVSPMRTTADAQFVFEHDVRAWVVAVAVGDLLKRWSEERRIVGVAEHAMLLVDECARFGLGERARCDEQQCGKKRTQCDMSGVNARAIVSRAMTDRTVSVHDR